MYFFFQNKADKKIIVCEHRKAYCAGDGMKKNGEIAKADLEKNHCNRLRSHGDSSHVMEFAITSINTFSWHT